ncbi:MAG: hypothetical protein WDW38_008149 [Sanguina aurantia]
MNTATEFARLLRLVARAFYSGPCPPKGYEDEPEHTRSKFFKIDTTGLGVVVLDYLARQQWVSEAMLMQELTIHPKLLRRALKYLEKERLLMSEHRRESRRRRKGLVAAAVAAAGSRGGWDIATLQLLADEDAAGDGGEEEEDVAAAADGVATVERGLTNSYYAVDYPGCFDMLQLRLHLMRKSLKDQLDPSASTQQYICPTLHCRKAYTPLDAVHLFDPETHTLRCDHCQAEVQTLTATGEVADEAARRSNLEETRNLLERLDYELRDIEPLVRVLRAPEHLSSMPNYGTLAEWATEETNRQRREQEVAIRNGGGPGRGGHGGGGTVGISALSSNYYSSETAVHVVVGGSGAEDAGKGAGAAGGAKASRMPQWLTKSSVTGLASNAAAAANAASAGGSSSAPPTGAAEDEEAARKRAFQEAYMAQFNAMIAAQQQQQQQQQQQMLQTQADQDSNLQQRQHQHPMGGLVAAGGFGAGLDEHGDVEWEDL